MLMESKSDKNDQVPESRKKKILITTVGPLYPISNGGIVRVIEEVKFLKNHNFDVFLVGIKTEPDSLKYLEKKLGVNLFSLSWVSWLSSGIGQKFGFFGIGWFYNPFIRFDLERIVRKIKPDIIQAEFIYEGMQVSKICKKYGIPFVLSEHNVESVLYKSIQDYEVKICNLANYITTVSEHDRNALEELNVTTRIKVIPNGVDSERFQPDPDIRKELRRRYRIKPTDTVIVYHGTLAYSPNREANEFLKHSLMPAIKTINPTIKLLLIGPKRTFSIGEDIIELNEVESDRLPDFLSMADIAVVPLISGSGTRLKLLEYFSLGVPVISTKIGAEGLPVIDGEHILITTGTVQDVIKKIDLLNSNSKLYNALVANAQNMVRDHFDWDVVFKGYLQLYGELENKRE
jgi:glycosyltransferase involved in cell wall biosynthesis